MKARREIYEELYGILKDIPSLRRHGNKLVPAWETVKASEMPSLFVVGGVQDPDTQLADVKPMPTRWRLRGVVYIVASDNLALQDLIDAVAKKVAENSTLNGTVKYARLAGPVQTDEGTLPDRAVAVLPVEMIAV